MYLFRVYIIEEYEVDANTIAEARKKVDKCEYEELSQWVDKTTLRKDIKKPNN
jgi:hypothetical protein